MIKVNTNRNAVRRNAVFFIGMAFLGKACLTKYASGPQGGFNEERAPLEVPNKGQQDHRTTDHGTNHKIGGSGRSHAFVNCATALQAERPSHYRANIQRSTPTELQRVGSRDQDLKARKVAA